VDSTEAGNAGGGAKSIVIDVCFAQRPHLNGVYAVKGELIGSPLVGIRAGRKSLIQLGFVFSSKVISTHNSLSFHIGALISSCASVFIPPHISEVPAGILALGGLRAC